MDQQFTLPTLYKYAKSGATQQWRIWANDLGVDGASYSTEYGQVGGKLQTTTVEVREGKNLGRSNESTPYAQAISEAQSKWNLQRDKGYSDGAPQPLRATSPMLAYSYADHIESITFPCHWQPKLDGIRCIVERNGDEITLLSRKGKEFDTLPHLAEQLLEILDDGDIFDGELYVHGVPFQTVVSWIKKQQPETAQVRYNVYDMVRDEPFGKRFFTRLCPKIGHRQGHINTVHTGILNSHTEINTILAEQEARGYEGIMLRVGDCTYQTGHRSSQLLKVKTFIDQEFVITGAEENKGRQKGQCSFICVTDRGAEFTVKPVGTDAQRREYWQRHQELVGKLLTVRFFEWTTSDPPKPRFPVGIAVRDYE